MYSRLCLPQFLGKVRDKRRVPEDCMMGVFKTGLKCRRLTKRFIDSIFFSDVYDTSESVYDVYMKLINEKSFITPNLFRRSSNPELFGAFSLSAHNCSFDKASFEKVPFPNRRKPLKPDHNLPWEKLPKVDSSEVYSHESVVLVSGSRRGIKFNLDNIVLGVNCWYNSLTRL